MTPSNHQPTTASAAQPTVHSLTQPVSESWCLTSVKVIKVGSVYFMTHFPDVFLLNSFPLTGR